MKDFKDYSETMDVLYKNAFLEKIKCTESMLRRLDIFHAFLTKDITKPQPQVIDEKMLIDLTGELIDFFQNRRGQNVNGNEIRYYTARRAKRLRKLEHLKKTVKRVK